MDNLKRQRNERLFPTWKALEGGGRAYWYTITEKSGWQARYVKEVDKQEETIKFYQEILDEKGNIVERHEKFPQDKGHMRIKGKGE